MQPSHEHASLSPAERRALVELEHQLSQNDPQLAGTLVGRTPPQRDRTAPPWWVGATLAALGMVAMLATFPHSAMLGFASVLVIAVGSALACAAAMARWRSATPG